MQFINKTSGVKQDLGDPAGDCWLKQGFPRSIFHDFPINQGPSEVITHPEDLLGTLDPTTDRCQLWLPLFCRWLIRSRSFKIIYTILNHHNRHSQGGWQASPPCCQPSLPSWKSSARAAHHCHETMPRLLQHRSPSYVEQSSGATGKRHQQPGKIV